LLADDTSLFRLAARIEGHPDNVAPAFYGGFTISGQDEDGEFFSVGSPVDPRVQVVVFVPPTPVSTEVARGLLPATVPHADAAADAGRTALLVAALAGQPEHLLRATRDYLHQQYRRPAMPGSLALVDQLRSDGVPALISGAGPTVLAFTDAAGAAALLDRCPDGWLAHQLDVETSGARLT
jgi:homoserine kinase